LLSHRILPHTKAFGPITVCNISASSAVCRFDLVSGKAAEDASSPSSSASPWVAESLVALAAEFFRLLPHILDDLVLLRV
jgi:hypothetical protein